MIECLVLVEARADADIATGLADRILLEHGPDWLADNLNYFRTWRGFDETTPFSCWKDIQRLYQGYKLPRYLGHFKSGHQKADAAAARKAMLLALEIQKKRPAIGALLLIRDLDHQPERRTGLNQARRQYAQPGLSIIIGGANPKREAWVLNGFLPQSDQENRSYLLLKKQLAFDPCLESQKLKTPSAGSKTERELLRDAKRVLDLLTAGVYEREAKCWCETPLSVLYERGENTGLVAYLDEIKNRLLPILS